MRVFPDLLWDERRRNRNKDAQIISGNVAVVWAGERQGQNGPSFRLRRRLQHKKMPGGPLNNLAFFTGPALLRGPGGRDGASRPWAMTRAENNAKN